MTRRILSALSVAVSLGCSVEATQDPTATGGSAGAGATGGTAGNGGSSGAGGSGTGGSSGGSGGAGALGGGSGAGVGGASTGGSGATSGSGAMGGSGGMSGSGQSEGGKGGANLGGAGSGGSAGSGGAITSGAGGSGGSGGSGGASRSEGCGKAAPASQRYSIDVGGTMREYIIAVPEDYDPERAYPLVFAWHPLGGSAQQVAGMGNSGYYGLRAQADGGAIFVSPEGLEFNGGNKGWANTNGRDIAFLEAMLTRFRGELCVDESRIFSTGFSFGGMMSFAVGCAMGGVFRAIAPMAGNIQVSGCEDGDQPVAVMGFHGLQDSVVSIDGGRDGRDVFIERNGCMEQTMPVEPSWCGGVGDNYQPCSCVSYQGCTPGYPVVWCEFTGPHTPAPNSAATIWSFFSQF